MNDDDAKAIFAKSQTLVRLIAPLLHGKGQEVQGAALADLVAMFFAGHHPDVRPAAIRLWLRCMRTMIGPNEEMLMPHGWPKDEAVQ